MPPTPRSAGLALWLACCPLALAAGCPTYQAPTAVDDDDDDDTPPPPTACELLEASFQCGGPHVYDPDVWPENWEIEWSSSASALLAALNDMRSRPQACNGVDILPPAPALVPDASLVVAARVHVADMAFCRIDGPEGSDGRTIRERFAEAGYDGSLGVGECRARGNTVAEVDALVESILDDPGHCTELMDPAFELVGVGQLTCPGTPSRNYWVVELGGS